MKMEQCSETSAFKIQAPGNYPEESIQHSEQGESLNQENILLKDRVFGLIYEYKAVSSLKNWSTRFCAIVLKMSTGFCRTTLDFKQGNVHRHFASGERCIV
jgi:hypothetical protein